MIDKIVYSNQTFYLAENAEYLLYIIFILPYSHFTNAVKSHLIHTNTKIANENNLQYQRFI
jgi:hypothetical protein